MRRRSRTLSHLLASLVPGQVYRRSDLLQRSSSDRHLAELVRQGELRKLARGMYFVPRVTTFGEAPPDESSLLRAFLKDDHFVVYGPSQFNALGLGTTQLYNRRVVFNRKRVGELTLGSRTYTFHRWREAPKTLSPEFLVVELLNRLDELVEDRVQVMKRLRNRCFEMNPRALSHAVRHYGTISTQKKFEEIMRNRPEGAAT